MQAAYPYLSEKDAEQRLHEFGPNKLKDTIHTSIAQILIRQIKKNAILYLLISGAVISFLVGKTFTAYTISLVILIVITIGFIQEYKAEQAIQSLRKLVMPMTMVIRDGKKKEIASEEIVPGDIIELRSGEKIPADALLLDEKELRINEAVLSGEATEIKKTCARDNTNSSDTNFIFAGTFIVNGRCIAQVTHTGMNTRIGKIAGMIETAEKELPLQKKINTISSYMVVIALLSSLFTGILIFSRAPGLNQTIIIETLILMIALAVSAFPEGLPVVLITTLAMGANRMAKQNAIVNRMSIIETLGETTVICSDKTGTITKGEMDVSKLYVNQKQYAVEDLSAKHPDKASLDLLVTCGVLCNDAHLQRIENTNETTVSGSPTESALIRLGATLEYFQDEMPFERLGEIPFNSARKMMSVVCDKENERFVFVKGAPEVLLKHCTYIEKQGKAVRLDKQAIEIIEDMAKQYTTQSLRTLALAYKKEKKRETLVYEEEELVFLGLVGIEDPPRENVAAAIRACETAGIQVKMITGDNKETARAIGQEVGIIGDLLEGSELDLMTDEELAVAVKTTSIFARVKPEHKLRIVRALKQNGEIVTMTGDGVNDAPALKEAHIGVAMGKNGTDVSRSVADLILKDDNFATIVHAIKEGRTIFNNIQQFVTYQLSCNISELMILFLGVLLAPVFSWETPILLALHILFMNLITDNLPAITLGFTPSSKEIMRVKPRKNREILNRKLITILISNSLMMCVMTLGVFYLSANVFHEAAIVSRTAALVTLIIVEIASAYNFKSFTHGVLGKYFFANKYLLIASTISFILTLIIMYSPARYFFETTPIRSIEWGFAIYAGIFLLILGDVIKEIRGEKRKAAIDIP